MHQKLEKAILDNNIISIRDICSINKIGKKNREKSLKEKTPIIKTELKNLKIQRNFEEYGETMKELETVQVN